MTNLFADFFKSVLAGRVARRVEDLDDETIRAIAAAEVPGRYAALDKLINDQDGDQGATEQNY